MNFLQSHGATESSFHLKIFKAFLDRRWQKGVPIEKYLTDNDNIQECTFLQTGSFKLNIIIETFPNIQNLTTK